jgi:rRNA maturation protein Rpf1
MAQSITGSKELLKCANVLSNQMEFDLAKKWKKKIVRREYTKADVKELRAHSKARTPLAKIMKLTKRTEGSLRQKALKLGMRLGHRR